MDAGLPVIILDLLAPFLDENIKTAEIFRLFSESVELLRCAMEKRLLLIGVKPVPRQLAPDRVCLAANLARNFGLIPVQDPMRQNTDAEICAASGYQQRPALKAFGMRNGASERQKNPGLMDGQPSLF